MIRLLPRAAVACSAVSALAVTATLVPSSLAGHATAVATSDTATPIEHLVVVFQENVSFDHYFATYPVATNPPGEPAFHADEHSAGVNGLSAALLTANPNSAPPRRLDRSQALSVIRIMTTAMSRRPSTTA